MIIIIVMLRIEPKISCHANALIIIALTVLTIFDGQNPEVWLKKVFPEYQTGPVYLMSS